MLIYWRTRFEKESVQIVYKYQVSIQSDWYQRHSECMQNAGRKSVKKKGNIELFSYILAAFCRILKELIGEPIENLWKSPFQLQ